MGARALCGDGYRREAVLIGRAIARSRGLANLYSPYVVFQAQAKRRMLALAVAQGEGLIDRAMVARVTRRRLLGGRS